MKIKDGFEFFGKEISIGSVVIVDADGNDAFDITMKDGKLYISGMTNLNSGIRGHLVVSPVAANVIAVERVK